MNFNKMTKKDISEYAKAHNIKLNMRLKKVELIKILTSFSEVPPKPKPKPTATELGFFDSLLKKIKKFFNLKNKA